MLYVREFVNASEMQDFLQGILTGTGVLPQVGLNVRGLTLIFTTPAVTVTFPDTVDFGKATASKIISEINSQTTQATAGLRVYGHGGNVQHIALIKNGDVLTGGTALPVLGLSAGTVGAAAIGKADVVQVLSRRTGVIALVYDA
jgi:hypothetical protein